MQADLRLAIIPVVVVALLAAAGYVYADYASPAAGYGSGAAAEAGEAAAVQAPGYTALDDVDHRRRGGMRACAAIGDVRPGQAIRILFQNHDRFEWSYREYPEDWRIEWVIEAEDEELAETLYYHVLQMECILERGGTPRAWDPVFKLESKLKPYIETEVELDGNVVKVVKTAENECAWEVIRLHAEVVKGFFERGWEEAREVHPIPDDVKEKCSDYLDEEE